MYTGKDSCKCWACGEVGHSTNKRKNRKNNKLIETLGRLDHFELSDEEAVDLTLKNKGIVKITMKYEYEESDDKETSHMMENSSISPGDLQGKEFTVDGNEYVKADWIFSIIQKDMIYKKFIFQLK